MYDAHAAVSLVSLCLPHDGCIYFDVQRRLKGVGIRRESSLLYVSGRDSRRRRSFCLYTKWAVEKSRIKFVCIHQSYVQYRGRAEMKRRAESERDLLLYEVCPTRAIRIQYHIYTIVHNKIVRILFKWNISALLSVCLCKRIERIASIIYWWILL